MTFAGRQPTPQRSSEVKKEFGLDKPVYRSSLHFVEARVPRRSVRMARPREVVRDPRRGQVPIGVDRMWTTIQLALGAAVVWLLVGHPHRGAVGPQVPRSSSTEWPWGSRCSASRSRSSSIGPIALYVFVYKWGSPPGPATTRPGSTGSFTWLSHFILPWLRAGARSYAAFYARMSRANLLETMGEDYIRTARAKGLSERTVIVQARAAGEPDTARHGVRSGPRRACLAGRSSPRRSSTSRGSVSSRSARCSRGDLYTILDVTIIAAFFVTLANLVVDIVYAFLDPRVRYT